MLAHLQGLQLCRGARLGLPDCRPRGRPYPHFGPALVGGRQATHQHQGLDEKRSSTSARGAEAGERLNVCVVARCGLTKVVGVLIVWVINSPSPILIPRSDLRAHEKQNGCEPGYVKANTESFTHTTVALSPQEDTPNARYERGHDL